MKDYKLTPKEKQFCADFALTNNLREAASRAGFRIFPERAGLKILQKEAAVSEIKRLKSKMELSSVDAASGLKRVAFGSVTDAVKLLFAEDITDEQLETLDLFSISEIKRPKGGGMEIKFFDRVKALEKLSEISSNQEDAPVQSFYDAIIKGADALNGTECDI